MLATNIVLIVILVFWQDPAGTVWRIENTRLAQAAYVLCGFGWLLVLFASFLTNHFDLFGLRQVYLQLLQKAYTPVAFREVLFYRWVRHPMMLGLLIAFWATSQMSVSHWLFSTGMTLYIFIGIHFEEAALQAELGAPYRAYQSRTALLLPWFKYRLKS